MWILRWQSNICLCVTVVGMSYTTLWHKRKWMFTVIDGLVEIMYFFCGINTVFVFFCSSNTKKHLTRRKASTLGLMILLLCTTPKTWPCSTVRWEPININLWKPQSVGELEELFYSLQWQWECHLIPFFFSYPMWIIGIRMISFLTELISKDSSVVLGSHYSVTKPNIIPSKNIFWDYWYILHFPFL